MDSKNQFYQTIYNYYKEIVVGNIPDQILTEICNELCDHFYNEYSRFKKQYPKSIKRYSTFLLKDLDHPNTFELIINFFKNKYGAKYKEFSCLMLKMTETELLDFEKNRRDFHNMF